MYDIKTRKHGDVWEAWTIIEERFLSTVGETEENAINQLEEHLREMELIDLAKKVVEQAEENAKINPTSDTIQVVVVEPMKRPYKKVIENKLENMQEIVDGYIENVFIGETSKGARVGVVVNEEGKLVGKPFNRRIMNFDILVGTFFITAYNLEGDSVSLTDEEANKYIRMFTPMEVYL